MCSERWFHDNPPFFIFPWHPINKGLKVQYAICQECKFIAYSLEEYKNHRKETGHHLEKV